MAVDRTGNCIFAGENEVITGSVRRSVIFSVREERKIFPIIWTITWSNNILLEIATFRRILWNGMRVCPLELVFMSDQADFKENLC